MLEEFQEQQRKKMTRARSMMDLVMGIIFFLVGILLLLFEVVPETKLPELNRKMLGGLFILYGIWRMYRSYKRDYFK